MPFPLTPHLRVKIHFSLRQPQCRTLPFHVTLSSNQQSNCCFYREAPVICSALPSAWVEQPWNCGAHTAKRNQKNGAGTAKAVHLHPIQQEWPLEGNRILRTGALQMEGSMSHLGLRKHKKKRRILWAKNSIEGLDHLPYIEKCRYLGLISLEKRFRGICLIFINIHWDAMKKETARPFSVMSMD